MLLLCALLAGYGSADWRSERATAWMTRLDKSLVQTVRRCPRQRDARFLCRQGLACLCVPTGAALKPQTNAIGECEIFSGLLRREPVHREFWEAV